MGFSKPKAVAPTVTPPPATATGADVAAAADQTLQDQENKNGYADTINPTRKRSTLIQMPEPPKTGTKKNLLGAVA